MPALFPATASLGGLIGRLLLALFLLALLLPLLFFLLGRAGLLIVLVIAAIGVLLWLGSKGHGPLAGMWRIWRLIRRLAPHLPGLLTGLADGLEATASGLCKASSGIKTAKKLVETARDEVDKFVDDVVGGARVRVPHVGTRSLWDVAPPLKVLAGDVGPFSGVELGPDDVRALDRPPLHFTPAFGTLWEDIDDAVKGIDETQEALTAAVALLREVAAILPPAGGANPSP